jgi:hypothetical protein
MELESAKIEIYLQSLDIHDKVGCLLMRIEEWYVINSFDNFWNKD